MRIQTYANWAHRHAAPPAAGTAAPPVDDLTGLIDDLIAQVAYYPSFVVEMTPDACGLLIGLGHMTGSSAGSGVQARVVRKGEPPVVVLRWCLQELRT